MNQITGEEFERIINKHPSWCKKLKEPLEITTFVCLQNSNITHLSPLITYTGKNNEGRTADFNSCPNLKVATGTFKGHVTFSQSNIEKIENLNVTGEEKNRLSCSFYQCPNLKVATGTYKGFVNFSESGVETIKDLIIEYQDFSGEKARFFNCPINYIPKGYRGKEFMFDDGIIEKSILKDKITKETINKIKSEANNIEI